MPVSTKTTWSNWDSEKQAAYIARYQELAEGGLNLSTLCREFDITDHQMRAINKTLRASGVIRSYKDYKIDADITPEDIDLEVQHDLELEEVRVRGRRTDAKYRRLLRQQAFEERLLTAAKAFLKTFTPVKAPTIPRLPESLRETPQADVANWSDFHWMETVDFDEMRGLNAYNFDMGKKRLEFLVDSMLNIRFRHHSVIPVKELNLNILGDLVSGEIHDELLATNEASYMEAVYIGGSVLAQAIRELAGHYPQVHIRSVPGNHARKAKQKSFKQRYVSWDQMMVHNARLMLRDQKNITWHIPKSFFTVAEIEGFKHLLYHGDDIKSWAGIPFYGISRAIGQFQQLISAEPMAHPDPEKRAESDRLYEPTMLDYIHIGHFHQATSLPMPRGELFVNGALIGTNEFAMGAMRAHSQPIQWFMGCHPEHGVTWRYPINVRAAHVNIPETRYRGEITGEIVAELEKAGL